MHRATKCWTKWTKELRFPARTVRTFNIAQHFQRNIAIMARWRCKSTRTQNSPTMFGNAIRIPWSFKRDFHFSITNSTCCDQLSNFLLYVCFDNMQRRASRKCRSYCNFCLASFGNADVGNNTQINNRQIWYLWIKDALQRFPQQLERCFMSIIAGELFSVRCYINIWQKFCALHNVVIMLDVVVIVAASNPFSVLTTALPLSSWVGRKNFGHLLQQLRQKFCVIAIAPAIDRLSVGRNIKTNTVAKIFDS